MNQLYAAYGRTFSTPIPLPLLPTGKEDELSQAVRIEFHAIPAPVSFPFRIGRVEYAVSDGELTVLVPGIARFHASSGKSIAVDALADPGDPTLGYCIAYLILPLYLSFDAVMLHGSAVVKETDGERGAVLLLGDKGSGKSTTAAHLSARDWRLLSDDIVPVDNHGLVLPGLALSKLLPDALESLAGLAAVRRLGYDGIGKFQVETPETDISARLWAVCIISADPSLESVEHDTLRGRRKIGSILPHVVGVEGIHTHKKLFSVVHDMVSGVPVYRLSRPAAGYPSQLADYIVQNITIGA